MARNRIDGACLKVPSTLLLRVEMEGLMFSWTYFRRWLGNKLIDGGVKCLPRGRARTKLEKTLNGYFSEIAREIAEHDGVYFKQSL